MYARCSFGNGGSDARFEAIDISLKVRVCVQRTYFSIYVCGFNQYVVHLPHFYTLIGSIALGVPENVYSGRRMECLANKSLCLTLVRSLAVSLCVRKMPRRNVLRHTNHVRVIHFSGIMLRKL